MERASVKLCSSTFSFLRLHLPRPLNSFFVVFYEKVPNTTMKKASTLAKTTLNMFYFVR